MGANPNVADLMATPNVHDLISARRRYDSWSLEELEHNMRVADGEDAPHPVPVDDFLPAIPWDLPIVEGPPPGVIMTQGQQVPANGVMVSYSEVIFLWEHGPALPPRHLPVAEDDTYPNQMQYWLCWWRRRPHRHWVCEQLREELGLPRRWRVVYWWSERDNCWVKFRRPQSARA